MSREPEWNDSDTREAGSKWQCHREVRQPADSKELTRNSKRELLGRDHKSEKKLGCTAWGTN